MMMEDAALSARRCLDLARTSRSEALLDCMLDHLRRGGVSLDTIETSAHEIAGLRRAFQISHAKECFRLACSQQCEILLGCMLDVLKHAGAAPEEIGTSVHEIEALRRTFQIHSARENLRHARSRRSEIFLDGALSALRRAGAAPEEIGTSIREIEALRRAFRRAQQPFLMRLLLTVWAWFLTATRALREVVTSTYAEIALARDGGLTLDGEFYPFPERFANAAHTEAFKGVTRFVLWGDPPGRTVGELRQAYADDFGPATSDAVWGEVAAWFVEQGLLRRGIRQGKAVVFPGV